MEWTAQEIFNKALFGIREQGSFSFMNGTCVYNHPAGFHCAAALVIPEERRLELREGVSISRTDPAFLQELGLWDYKDFLQELQTIHDKYALYPNFSFEKWEEEMFELAQKSGLVYTPPAPPNFP